jgi:hypothetical protein
MAQCPSNTRTGGSLREWRGNASAPTARWRGIAIDVKNEPSLLPQDFAGLLAASKTTTYSLRLGEQASARIDGRFECRRAAVAGSLASGGLTVRLARYSPLWARPRKQWVPVDAA